MLDRILHRQIRRHLAPQDAVNIFGCTPISIEARTAKDTASANAFA
jgi:hypothetical protein